MAMDTPSCKAPNRSLLYNHYVAGQFATRLRNKHIRCVHSRCGGNHQHLLSVIQLGSDTCHFPSMFATSSKIAHTSPFADIVTK